MVLDKNFPDVTGVLAVGEMLRLCLKLEWFSFLGCRPREGIIHLANGLLAMVTATADGKTRRHPLRWLELDELKFGEAC